MLCSSTQVFRPVDDVRMAASLAAVVSFIEGATIGGSRDWPLDMILDILADPKTTLPDLGIAPNSMLLSAIRRGVVEMDASPFTSLEQWLSVRCRDVLFCRSPRTTATVFVPLQLRSCY